MFGGKFTQAFDVAVFRNRVRVVDRESGRSAERSAVHPFSTAALLIANRECLEEEIRQLLRQLPRKSWLVLYPTVRVSEVEHRLEPVEREALKQALADVGFHTIELPEEQSPTP